MLIVLIATIRAFGTARAGPLVCQTYVPVSASVATNSTNATISWNIGAQSSVLLYWGNSTNYNFTAINGTIYPSGGYTTFLDYLQPSKEYYFHLIAIESPGHPGVCPGSVASQWGTGLVSITAMSGVVKDSNGAVFSQGGILITAYCIDLPSGADSAPTQGVTSSTGYYDFALPGYYTEAGYFQCTNSPVHLLLTNLVTTYWVLNNPYKSTQWAGHWNETMIVWAPQVVNFVLPSDYLTGYTPGIVDFSDAPTDSGYTTLEVDQGTGYENSYTYDWSAGAQVVGFGGGSSGSTTAGTGVTAQIGWQATTDSLCVAYQYEVSGTVEYTAISRSWAFGQTLFDAQNGEFCNQAGVSVPTNWFGNETNPNEDIHLMPGPVGSAWVNGLQNVPLWKGDSIPYLLTISSSASATTGFNVDFGLSASLAGVLPLSFQASESWSQTVTSLSSTELAYDIVGPSSTEVSCYSVFGEGGSLSADTADMVAIYYWTGSVVSEKPVCT